MGLGVSPRHVKGILDVAVKNNFFLFIRPTEDDSIRLIDAGFPTKSMDIHDKSSNWGPMAGMVPCDSAFSKRPEGKAPAAQSKPHSHGSAHALQLKLPHEVRFQLNGLTMTDAVFGATVVPGSLPIQAETTVKATFHLYGNPTQANHTFSVYKAKNAPPGPYGDIYFAIDQQNQVWWVNRRAADSHLSEAPVTLEPMWVWGYRVGGQLKPVTGDYDVWALVPHVSTLGHVADHALIKVDRDEHGNSAASPYFIRTAAALNAACERSHNTVFNHGAEAQNKGFTQKHDDEILMFPPVDDPSRVRKIRIDDMVHVLAEIQRAGYFVVLNRQWTVPRPTLMGKKPPEILAAISRENKAKLAQLQQSAGAQGAQAKQLRWDKLRAHSLQVGAEAQMEASKRLDPERDKMARWYGELKAALDAYDQPLKALASQDFPESYRVATKAMQGLQRAIESTATNHMTGGGQNLDMGTVGALAGRQKEIDDLLAYWTGPGVTA